MLKLYRPRYIAYENGTLIWNEIFDKVLLTEEEKETKTKIVTIENWEDLEEKYRKYHLCLPFDCYETKKGRKLYYYNSLFSKYKEWKHKELNFKIVIEYEEIEHFSIKDILELKDSERAIQYLKENGLNVCPIK